jgi:hypothetical protein
MKVELKKQEILNEVSNVLNDYGYKENVNISYGSLTIEIKIRDGKPSCSVKERIINKVTKET